ncbi:RNA chaperone Hfq [Tepidibacter formicigenes]|uniref:RNA-binding protein Hfq n=1 Tax=Tepidibacter formicigenes DSM 15518 TaxID=1123349 RepID=A0A1M6M5B5_9FIRM|nr:RNA chaperone Hfq [Tepidibacter formicigenes]SHJ78627.1 host factor-I protein [Tepidibacter formicigenes DSM 15518]
MKNNALNLQDLFLNQARREKIGITIFLMNGVQLKGLVKGFDSYIIILENEGKQQMIYKHAVSTIIPSKNINLINNNNQGSNR